MKYKDIKFNQVFLDVIDDLLSELYSEIHSREDFLFFFYFFDHHLAYSDDEWIQFDMHSARKIFGRQGQKWKLQAIIKSLSDKKIIESTSYYFDLQDKNNSTTRKYRYTEEFERRIINEEIKFATGNISQKSYERFVKANKPTEIHLLAQYEILNSERFKIDLDLGMQWLIDKLKSRSITKNSFHVNCRVLLSIDNKDYIYVKKDENTGRVFTSFSCMKRELRSFCTIDNEKLDSVDLKAAQPTFLVHHLLAEHPDNKDVREFYRIVTEEDIYNFLDQHFYFREMYARFMPDELRDQSKIEFMRWIFSDARGSTDYSKAIKKEFPDVWKFVQNEKTAFKRKKTNYAIELQKIEASIFIEGMRDIFHEGVLSVHDSLYFKTGLKAKVHEALRESLLKNKIKSFQLK